MICRDCKETCSEYFDAQGVHRVYAHCDDCRKKKRDSMAELNHRRKYGKDKLTKPAANGKVWLGTLI